MGLVLLSIGCGRVGFEASFAVVPDASDGAIVDDGSPDAGAADASVADAAQLGDTFGEICRFTRGTVVNNGLALDFQAGMSAAASVSAACGGSFVYDTASQDDVGILEPGTDRPLLGPGTLMIAAGGYTTQRVVGYLEGSITPIDLDGSGPSYTMYDRTTGLEVARFDMGTITAGHDFGVVQVAFEPVSETLVLSVYGGFGNGTTMAAWWFANVLAADIELDAHRYYVIEWTDMNGDSQPDAGDAFVVRASA